MTPRTFNEVDWRKGMGFFRYSLPVAGGGIREGILIRLENSEGAVGWGDAAPLPGWSAETLDDVIAAIRSGESEAQGPSSLVCAIEAARCSLQKYEIWSSRCDHLPLNALLDGSFQEMLERAGSALARGCRCFKIKVAGLSPEDLPSLLSSISELANGQCRFRIDPNRAWEFDATLRVAETLKEYPVDYLEEPLRNFSMLPELIKQCPVGIALDETLREISPSELPAFKGASALVLKPTLMGGFKVCRDFADVGAALGMASVVSACYESGVGIYALGRFSLTLPRSAAAGLDTYSRLDEDVLCERLDLGDFIFHGDSLPPDVDISQLHPL
jgi:O-succinylbenzoate synthase